MSRRALTLRRRPREEAVPELVEPEVDLPAVATAREQVVSSLAAKAATVLLIAALLCGPLGLAVAGLAVYWSAAPAPVAPVSVQDRSGERAAAGEFAQRVVVAWLTTPRGQEDQLAALVQAPTVTLPDVPFTASDPTVSSIALVDGVWSVTALSLPAPVSGPTVGALPRMGYRFQVDPAGPVAQTAAQFLGAYIAGQGDVTRYVSPTTQIQPVTPAPYTAVQVTDLAGDTDIDTAGVPKDRARLRVLVGADASVTSKQQVSVAYALTLLARAGRWEVQAIDATPALADQPSGPATPAAGSPTVAGSPASPSTSANPTSR